MDAAMSRANSLPVGKNRCLAEAKEVMSRLLETGTTDRSFPCAHGAMALTSGEYPRIKWLRKTGNGEESNDGLCVSEVERWLTNHPLVVRPVGRPHHFLVHLAHGRQRQLTNEFDALGCVR